MFVPDSLMVSSNLYMKIWDVSILSNPIAQVQLLKNEQITCDEHISSVK
jgi:hypothetical protein